MCRYWKEISEYSGIDNVLVNLVATTRRMSISHIINSDDLDIYEEVSNAEMAESVLGELVRNVESGDEGQYPDELDSTSFIQSTIALVSTVMLENESQPVLNLRLKRDLSSILRTQ